MNTYYVACISGELEYKRWSVENMEQFVRIINNFQESQYDKKLTLKRYNVENECDCCIDCLGKDILKIDKNNY